MMYEVIERITLTVEAGSRVFVSKEQAALAAAYLKELPPMPPSENGKTEKAASVKNGAETKK